jgi:Bardet-Biedl syndrome 5 protein
MDHITSLLSGNSPILSKPSSSQEFFWHDREIRFDVNPKLLNPSSGETVLGVIEDVEDTKGQFGDAGKLLVSDLRVMWVSKKTPKVNLGRVYSDYERKSECWLTIPAS